MKRIENYITSLFGIGYLSCYQGSVASLVVGFIWYLFIVFVNPGLYLQLGCLIFMILISVVSINKYMLKSTETDPDEIVIDEACGIIISMLFMNLVLPGSDPYSDLRYLGVSLFIFRLLDGLKPSFIYRIQILNTPSSILLDDIAAGLISLIVSLSLRLNFII